jgi:ABC-type Na+ efflux pump permease subunit
MRWGLGPVFVFEWITNARRWQVYAARAFGAFALLTAMFVVWWSQVETRGRLSIRAQAQLGEYYFYALIGVEIALMMIAAPAATAGAICVDRARGTLSHVLMTDLSDPEIVLGKLAARLMPVFGLIACSWPVLALGSLLGGIDPTALTLAIGVVTAVAVLGCSMALTISIWAKKPHEVVMACYVFCLVVLLAWPIWNGIASNLGLSAPPRWVLLADPFFLAFVPYIEPTKFDITEYLGFFACTMAASATLALIAVWRMRPACTREAVRSTRSAGVLHRLDAFVRAISHIPRPPMDRNPVLWREWNRARPSRWMAVLVTAFAGTTAVGVVWESINMLVRGINPSGPNYGVLSYVFQIMFGLLMLAAIAPTSLSEERQRGSLDVLLATPLSTRTIVYGKWLGTFRFVPLLVVCPLILTLAMATGDLSAWLARIGTAGQDNYDRLTLAERLLGVSLLASTLVANGAAIVSLGLLLATWVRRQSRAIAISVSGFVLTAIAWPILVMVLSRGGGPSSVASGVAALSPIWSAGNMADCLSIRMPGARQFFGWLIFWDLVVGAVAFVLLELTVRTFDRSFSRVPETGGLPEAYRVLAHRQDVFLLSAHDPRINLANRRDDVVDVASAELGVECDAGVPGQDRDGPRAAARAVDDRLAALGGE